MSPERRALVRAMKVTGVVLGLLALTSGAIAGWAGGSGAVWAALAGVGVAAFVGFSTQAVMFVGSRFSPTALMGIILGSFGVKAAVLLLILWAVSGSEMPRAAFVLPLVIGAVATLAIVVAVVVRARVPYVSPGHGEEAG